MMGKKRFLAHKIETLMGMFPCVAVIGPRQCGKSTLVRALYPDWKYYDLERPDDYQLITGDPLGFFTRQHDKTIIDEAQQFPDLFKVLRGIIDQDRKACGRFLLTGSSSPEIVRGLSESLAGRIATREKQTRFFTGSGWMNISQTISAVISNAFFHVSIPTISDFLLEACLIIPVRLLIIPPLQEHWK